MTFDFWLKGQWPSSVNYDSGSKAMPLTEIPCHVEITFLALKEVLVVVVQDDQVHFEVHKPSCKAGVVCL